MVALKFDNRQGKDVTLDEGNSIHNGSQRLWYDAFPLVLTKLSCLKIFYWCKLQRKYLPETFLFSTASIKALGPTKSPIQWVPRAVYH
jgi:hypothetical protein